MLRKIVADPGYPREALIMAAVLYGMFAMAVIVSEIGTLDMLYFEAGSFRWLGGLLAVCLPPGGAILWYATQERDTWFSGRVLAAWAIGIAIAFCGAFVRNFFHL